MNTKTKIIIAAFLILMAVYAVDKFFDRFTLVSPVKELKLQFIIQKRESSSKMPSSPRRMPADKSLDKKRVKISFSKNLAKFGTTRGLTHKTRSGFEAIYIYFGTNKMAYAIAMAESGMNCGAVSKTNDYGLFQINKVHLWRFEKFGGNPFDCWDNARVAKEIQEEQGWYPWSTFKNKSYLAFIN